MATNWRRFARIGLYVSVLAILFSVGYYIVQRQFDLVLQISLGLIVIGLAVYALLDPEHARQLLTGRQARYGSNALVLTVAFIGILFVINYLAIKNSKRWDLTEGKQFTLAKETIDTLGKLSQPVHAVAFYTKQTPSDTAKSLLDQYQYNSNGKFDYEFIDPNANPAAAQQAKITRDGTIVLNMSGHQEAVTNVTEQDLTGGLVRLLNPEKRAVYFITGHGEPSIDQGGQESYATLKTTLESKNYTVTSLNLLVENQIPADAKVIVVAGPKKQLSQSEVDMLSAFQDQGGALVVLEDPLPITQFGDAPDPLADYLAKKWDIKLGADIVIDMTSQQPFAPYAARYGSSPITENLQTLTAQFPTVRSVSVMTNTISGVSPVELVFTARQSWAETNLDQTALKEGKSKPDPGQDPQGPIALGASAENFQSKARVVAFGDADFPLDVNFFAYANGDLMVNSVDWAAGQEAMINLTPKETKTRMMLPPQSAIMNLILLGTVIIIPGLALVAGIWVWFMRRRRA
jgi:ABC-type uncharacterized transport system involved in gliding motility auxiliary subunit